MSPSPFTSSIYRAAVSRSFRENSQGKTPETDIRGETYGDYPEGFPLIGGKTPKNIGSAFTEEDLRRTRAEGLFLADTDQEDIARFRLGAAEDGGIGKSPSSPG